MNNIALSSLLAAPSYGRSAAAASAWQPAPALCVRKRAQGADR